MKHISFDPRFVDSKKGDLISGKIHTIRQNYNYWKQFEGKEVALFTWKGLPYQKGSKHKVFCVKRIVSVQEVKCTIIKSYKKFKGQAEFDFSCKGWSISLDKLSENDGFERVAYLKEWFFYGNYKSGKMAIIHFTDFKY